MRRYSIWATSCLLFVRKKMLPPSPYLSEKKWNWTGSKQDLPMVSRRILVTKPEINGKTLGSMHFRSTYGVNVTRVNRSGMDLFAEIRT